MSFTIDPQIKNLSKDLIEVAVIGGGSTGISFVCQFLRKMYNHSYKNKFSLTLFEPSDTLGIGLAYGAESHTLLLNSPAACFSIYPDNYKHFFEWLIQNEDVWRKHFPEIKKITEESFLPRKLAGLYLKTAAQESQKLANQHKITYRIVKEEVIDIVEMLSQNKARIITKSNKISYSADHIILCTGNCPPETYLDLKAYPNYFHEIHSCENKIKKILPSLSSVLIIGTRLSAIDAALMLNEEKHKCSITMASREGRLPSVKNEFKIYKMKYLTKEKINEQLRKDNSLKITHLLNLITEEASNIYKQKITIDDIANYPYNDNLSTLKSDLANVKIGKALWQKIPASFINNIEIYWSNFSIEEKKQYIKKYVSIMQRYTSAFPVINAEKIVGMMENKALFIKDRLMNVEYDKNRQKFVALFDNEEGLVKRELFDCVLNATGSGKNLVNSGSLLYKNLLKSNVINFNIFGGLDVSIKNFKAYTKKDLHVDIYAAGSPTFGPYFFTNFFYTSAKQSQIIVDEIFRVSCVIHKTKQPIRIKEKPMRV